MSKKTHCGGDSKVQADSNITIFKKNVSACGYHCILQTKQENVKTEKVDLNESYSSTVWLTGTGNHMLWIK